LVLFSILYSTATGKFTLAAGAKVTNKYLDVRRAWYTSNYRLAHFRYSHHKVRSGVLPRHKTEPQHKPC